MCIRDRYSAFQYLSNEIRLKPNLAYFCIIRYWLLIGPTYLSPSLSVQVNMILLYLGNIFNSPALSSEEFPKKIQFPRHTDYLQRREFKPYFQQITWFYILEIFYFSSAIFRRFSKENFHVIQITWFLSSLFVCHVFFFIFEHNFLANLPFIHAAC